LLSLVEFSSTEAAIRMTIIILKRLRQKGMIIFKVLLLKLGKLSTLFFYLCFNIFEFIDGLRISKKIATIDVCCYPLFIRSIVGELRGTGGLSNED
jgi:hypothetical protein